ncbi:MAG: uridine kinase [Lentimicrobiaceae bacterium]|nr:uridine kinase [Lentimicrobiaceae bacterium]
MFIIGVAGGSGSGKTTVVRKIVKQLPTDSISTISLDSYYKDSSHLTAQEKLNVNFDHPDSFEWSLLIEHVKQLRNGKAIEMPTYSYITSSRLTETITVLPSDIIIIEGIMVFTNRKLVDLLDLKVFVDAESDDRLARIIGRDTVERGRSVEQVLEHYYKWVKPMHLQFIEPCKRLADIIVPQGGENDNAIDLIVSGILMKLQ